jgi:hypothetical protein
MTPQALALMTEVTPPDWAYKALGFIVVLCDRV